MGAGALVGCAGDFLQWSSVNMICHQELVWCQSGWTTLISCVNFVLMHSFMCLLVLRDSWNLVGVALVSEGGVD